MNVDLNDTFVIKTSATKCPLTTDLNIVTLSWQSIHKCLWVFCVTKCYTVLSERVTGTGVRSNRHEGRINCDDGESKRIYDATRLSFFKLGAVVTVDELVVMEEVFDLVMSDDHAKWRTTFDILTGNVLETQTGASVNDLVVSESYVCTNSGVIVCLSDAVVGGVERHSRCAILALVYAAAKHVDDSLITVTSSSSHMALHDG